MNKIEGNFKKGDEIFDQAYQRIRRHPEVLELLCLKARNLKEVYTFERTCEDEDGRELGFNQLVIGFRFLVDETYYDTYATTIKMPERGKMGFLKRKLSTLIICAFVEGLTYREYINPEDEPDYGFELPDLIEGETPF